MKSSRHFLTRAASARASAPLEDAGHRIRLRFSPVEGVHHQDGEERGGRRAAASAPATSAALARRRVRAREEDGRARARARARAGARARRLPWPLSLLHSPPPSSSADQPAARRRGGGRRPGRGRTGGIAGEAPASTRRRPSRPAEGARAASEAPPEAGAMARARAGSEGRRRAVHKGAVRGGGRKKAGT